MSEIDKIDAAEMERVADVLEAWFMGLTASVWGDITYSQAVDSTFPTPVLDPQAQVYAALQLKLDQAIASLNAANPADRATVAHEREPFALARSAQTCGGMRSRLV